MQGGYWTMGEASHCTLRDIANPLFSSHGLDNTASQHSMKAWTKLNPYPTPLQPLTIRRYEVNGSERFLPLGNKAASTFLLPSPLHLCPKSPSSVGDWLVVPT
jgi:hypothetical protein